MNGQKPEKASLPTIHHGGHPTIQLLLGIYPIRQAIMSFLDTRDVLRLCQTSWTMGQDLLANEWNINQKLLRFVKAPLHFRSQLGQSDGLICGNFALEFLNRVVWDGTDLAILVRGGPQQQDLAKYLADKEGYVINGQGLSLSPPGTLDYFKAGEYIEEVQTYSCKNWEGPTSGIIDKEERKVQIIVTRGPPIQAILRHSHTSAMVNFISWAKAYSVFPRTTFLLHETVPLNHEAFEYGCLQSYLGKRGWRMRTDSVIPEDLVLSGEVDYEASFEAEFDWYRRVGGKYTWCLRLDTISVVKPAKPESVLEYSFFSIPDLENQGYHTETSFDSWSDQQSTLNVGIHADGITSHSLRYEYTDSSLYKHLWGSDLLHRLSHNTLLQLTKLRPSELARLIPDRDDPVDDVAAFVFEHPEGWDYYDDDIPRFYEEWSKKHLHRWGQ